MSVPVETRRGRAHPSVYKPAPQAQGGGDGLRPLNQERGDVAPSPQPRQRRASPHRIPWPQPAPARRGPDVCLGHFGVTPWWPVGLPSSDFTGEGPPHVSLTRKLTAVINTHVALALHQARSHEHVGPLCRGPVPRLLDSRAGLEPWAGGLEAVPQPSTVGQVVLSSHIYYRGN